jgi:hypothetical protein
MNIGLALIAADRHEYFARTAAAISRNEPLPVHLFVDMMTNVANQNRVIKTARMLLGKRLQSVHARPHNWGLVRNIIDARRHIFDTLGYNYAFVMEDDMVVSDNYCRYVTNMMKWAEANFDNVGAVQGWAPCFLPHEEKKLLLPYVADTHHHLWGYLMSKRCWDLIKDEIYVYERVFASECRYSDNISSKVGDVFRSMIRRANAQPGRQYDPLTHSWSKMDAHYTRPRAFGQDAATAIAMLSKRLVRLAPVVNRGFYIGAVGYHMDADRYESLGYTKMSLNEFSEDATIDTFIPCKKIDA